MKADNEFMRLFSGNKTEAQRYREALKTIAVKIEDQKVIERHRERRQLAAWEIEFGRSAIFEEIDKITEAALTNVNT